MKRIAVPVAIQNLMSALVGASDALMLGRLSQNAVAAVSLANEISFVMSLFLMTAVGAVGTLTAQYHGKGDRGTEGYLFCSALRYSVGIAAVFFLMAQVVPEKLMLLYTSDPELLGIGAEYLKIVSWSFLFDAVSRCYLLMMRICGRAAKSASIAVMTVIVDMTADLFLIYGLCGLPKCGANGSAWSTVIVELAAMIWVIAESHQGDHLRPAMKQIAHFSGLLEKDLLRLMGPMLTASLAWGLGVSVHSVVMGHMGSNAAAAASIATVTKNLVTCAGKGISSAAGIMIGGRLGRNDLAEAKKCGDRLVCTSFVCGACNAALVLLLTPFMVLFFILTDTARSYLIWMLVFTALYTFAHALNTIVVNGIFFAGGDAKYDSKTVTLSMWCFSIPLAALGAFVFRWPVLPVYMLVCSDEIVKLPWLIPHYRKHIWLKNLTRDSAV